MVHLGREAEATAWLRKHRLEDAIAIADPERTLYRAFALKRGGFREFLSPKVLFRALLAGALFRHGAGKPAGDPLQMPGAFLLRDGRIVGEFRHRTAADRPDYVALALGGRR